MQMVRPNFARVLVLSIAVSAFIPWNAATGSDKEVSKFYSEYYAVSKSHRLEVLEKFGFNNQAWPIKGKVAPVGSKIYVSLTDEGYGIYALGIKKPIILPLTTENATLCLGAERDGKSGIITGINIDPAEIGNCKVAAFFLYVDTKIYFWNIDRNSRGYFDYSEVK